MMISMCNDVLPAHNVYIAHVLVPVTLANTGVDQDLIRSARTNIRRCVFSTLLYVFVIYSSV